jgi:ABC-type dipeptide/oligopeptide/nickel transport system permease subunit
VSIENYISDSKGKVLIENKKEYYRQARIPNGKGEKRILRNHFQRDTINIILSIISMSTFLS